MMKKGRVIICCLFVCVLFVVHPHMMDMLTKSSALNSNQQVFEIEDKKHPETENEQIKYQKQYVNIPIYSIGKPVDLNTSKNNSNNIENEKKPKYVYIDLGARNGDTIDWYLKTYPKRVPSIIWAFEANPLNYELMDKYWTKHRDLDIRVIKKAAWINNKGVEFTLDNRPGFLTGGSMFNNNQPYLKNAPKVKVESVDFSSWLMNNTASTDDIIIKMDIEGAEYDILDKMFVDGTINRVNIIIIEWHDRFMPGKKHAYLTQNIKKLNIRIIEWH